MAGTYTLSHQTVFGDMRVTFYDVTNFTNSETLTIPGIRKIYHKNASIETQNKSIGMTVAANVITFVCDADTYDGTLEVHGK